MPGVDHHKPHVLIKQLPLCGNTNNGTSLLCYCSQSRWKSAQTGRRRREQKSSGSSDSLPLPRDRSLCRSACERLQKSTLSAWRAWRDSKRDTDYSQLWGPTTVALFLHKTNFRAENWLSVQGNGNKQTKKLHFQVVTMERTLEIHGIFLVAQQPNSNLNAYLHCWCVFSLCVCAATDSKTNVQLQQIAANVWLMCSILFIYMIWQCSTHQTGLEVWLEYLLNSPGAVHSAPV